MAYTITIDNPIVRIYRTARRRLCAMSKSVMVLDTTI